MGVLSISHYKNIDHIFFTNGLERIELRGLHTKEKIIENSKIFLITKSLYNLKSKYYERLFKKDQNERYIFFRNSPTSIQIFEIKALLKEVKIELLTKFDKLDVQKIVDFTGYNQDYLCTLSKNGAINSCNFRNGVILKLPEIKENLEESEEMITCSIPQEGDFLFVSSLFKENDSIMKQSRIFVYKINKRNGLIVNQFFNIDLKNEKFSLNPNSFIKEISVFNFNSNNNNSCKILVCFPHAGGSELLALVYYGGKMEIVKVVKEYHTRSVISLDEFGGRIWTLDGNGVICSASMAGFGG